MITLNQNVFVATITNLIAYSLYHDNYRVGDDVGRLLEVFRSDDVPNGDGKVVHTSSLPQISNLDVVNSSLLTPAPPVIQEQYIPVSEYKKVSLTINQYLLRGAFVDEYALALLASYLLNTMQIAKKLHMYERVRLVIMQLAGLATGTTVTGFAYDATDPATEDNAKRTANTNLFYRALIEEIKGAGKGQTILNTDPNASPQTSFKCYERPDNMVCIISDKLFASLDVDTLATLLKSQEITKDIQVDFLTMDYSTIGLVSLNDNVAVLLSKDKVQYGYFYQVATQFFDGSNLNTNNWLHFSDYCDQVYEAYAKTITVTNFY